MSHTPVRGLRVAAGDEVAVIRSSTRADGDFAIEVPAAALAHRRAAFQAGAWTQLDEVHGIDVCVVHHPGQHDGAVGDAAVTARRGAVVGAWVGDCAAVALVADNGVVGVSHAGWRGALNGVLPATVSAMRSLGARGVITAFLGPCIHGCCYEFGTDLLPAFTARFGTPVQSVTTWGTPSLHMPAVVEAALVDCGVHLDQRLTGCTACHPEQWFSHRRGDTARQVLTVTTMAPA